MEHTRKQYLNGECTHREYYAQFVTEYIKETVLNQIGLDKILASTGDSLNDIPLSNWDMMRQLPRSTFDHLKESGDYMTLAGKVCICKEAAKQIKEDHQGGNV